MSKIVRTINAMLSNAGKITETLAAGGDYYFVYDGKHRWSIGTCDDGYALTYFATSLNLSAISRMRYDGGALDMINPVTYLSNDIGTREARESFRELFMTVRDRASGLDRVMDEIIGDDEK